MKRLVIILLLCISNMEAYEGSLSARVAYVSPTDHRVREIFGSSMPLFQLEFDYGICPPFRVFASGGYQYSDGHYKEHEGYVRFKMVPFQLGVKYNLCDNLCIDPYLGLGFTYSFVDVCDEEHHEGRTNLGGVAKAGLFYNFSSCGFIELYVDYFYSTFNLPHAEKLIGSTGINASSFNFGGGIGFKF